jgi:hypothetical protein
VTGGLSNLLSLQSTYAAVAKDKATADTLKRAALLVSTTNTIIIKDLAKPPTAQYSWKPATEHDRGRQDQRVAQSRPLHAGQRQDDA